MTFHLFPGLWAAIGLRLYASWVSLGAHWAPPTDRAVPSEGLEAEAVQELPDGTWVVNGQAAYGVTSRAQAERLARWQDRMQEIVR